MKRAIIMCMQMNAIEVSPARYQLIKEMKERGIEIYLFLCGRLNIEARKIRKDIRYFLNTDGMNNKEIRRKIRQYNPDIVIAFTYEDTEIIYSLPLQLLSTDFYYFNLEINSFDYYLQPYKKHTWNYWIKKIKYPFSVIKESFYTKNCELMVIQDETRKKIAQRYYISNKETIFIPNSYIFDSNIEFHADRSGIIYSGGARKKYLIDYLEGFYAVTSVPIVFSGSFDDWSENEIRSLHRTNPNIRIEKQILECSEYTKYLQKYAVGLICYSKSDDDNINYIGLSSGKFFKHLSLGQPVIVIGHSRISYEVKRYGLGIVVEDALQIEYAYTKIMERYNYYQQNVIQTYQDKYDFKKVIAPFLDKL
jgi:hypothetical protein